eukprot:g471.t1
MELAVKTRDKKRQRVSKTESYRKKGKTGNVYYSVNKPSSPSSDSVDKIASDDEQVNEGNTLRTTEISHYQTKLEDQLCLLKNAAAENAAAEKVLECLRQYLFTLQSLIYTTDQKEEHDRLVRELKKYLETFALHKKEIFYADIHQCRNFFIQMRKWQYNSDLSLVSSKTEFREFLRKEERIPFWLSGYPESKELQSYGILYFLGYEDHMRTKRRTTFNENWEFHSKMAKKLNWKKGKDLRDWYDTEGKLKYPNYIRNPTQRKEWKELNLTWKLYFAGKSSFEKNCENKDPQNWTCENARTYIHNIKPRFKNRKDFWQRVHMLPEGFPRNPERLYNGKPGTRYADRKLAFWADFLGYHVGKLKRITKNKRSSGCLDFQSAREIVRGMKLQREGKWRKAPTNVFWSKFVYPKHKAFFQQKMIPKTPDYTYKHTGFNGFNDWLGFKTTMIHNAATGLRPSKKNLKDYTALCKEHNIKSKQDWMKFKNTEVFKVKYASEFRKDPPSHFKARGPNCWTSWRRMCGLRGPPWKKFEEANEEVLKLHIPKRFPNLSCHLGWLEALKQSDLIPIDIPASPAKVYEGEFKSWNAWVGREKQTNR